MDLSILELINHGKIKKHFLECFFICQNLKLFKLFNFIISS